LVELLTSLRGCMCFSCMNPICSHEGLMSVVAGFKDEPRCCDCLAKAMKTGRANARDRMVSFIQGRPCFVTAWNWASDQEGFGKSALPRCLWPGTETPTVASPVEILESKSVTQETPQHDQFWDAGEMGCGDLVLELRVRLRELKAGQILKIAARDPGAPEDLPAWCRMTGHSLVSAKHPEYFIQRKEN